MDKIKKSLIKSFVKEKLATNPVWARQALLRIYEKQTADEQKMSGTIYYNGVGFNGTDGMILSSFAKQLLKRGRLSDKQMEILMKKIPKYWEQIVMLSDKEKLISLINE